MKKEGHPKYQKCTITCVCGNVIETRSVLKEIRVEICSNCHPFFTGKQKLMDTAGRVERYRRKYGMSAEQETSAPVAKKAGDAKVTKRVTADMVATRAAARAVVRAAKEAAEAKDVGPIMRSDERRPAARPRRAATARPAAKAAESGATARPAAKPAAKAAEPGVKPPQKE